MLEHNRQPVIPLAAAAAAVRLRLRPLAVTVVPAVFSVAVAVVALPAKTDTTPELAVMVATAL